MRVVRVAKFLGAPKTWEPGLAARVREREHPAPGRRPWFYFEGKETVGFGARKIARARSTIDRSYYGTGQK